jgi:hypothetical protein
LRHEFASNQNYNTVSSLPDFRKTYSELGCLSYDEHDYDLYLYNGSPDAGGVVVAQSTTRQRGTASSSPYEAITYTPTTSGLSISL